MNPEKVAQIRTDAMLDLAREHAIETMTGWFLDHYEDPAQNTPYDSAEGGYIFIWGGPFDAREVLFEHFGGEFDERDIEIAAKELERRSSEWARKPTEEDFVLGSEPVSEHLVRAVTSLAAIRDTLNKQDGSEFLNALLFAHIVGILEAFLYESFAAALKERNAIKKFVKTDPTFKTEKIRVSEIYETMDSIEQKVGIRLHSIVYHRLDQVQRMYRETLGVEMPSGIAELLRAVEIRHDIVHRNCARKDGTKFSISKEQVGNLVTLADAFINGLAKTLHPPQS